MKNIKLTISYDGTKYKGFQRLKNTDMTLQGKLEDVLSKIFEKKILITATSRTDKGVHAKGQIANFHVPTTLSTHEIREQINDYLPKDIVITKVDFMPQRFHSRHVPSKKVYRYKIWRKEYQDVFNHPFEANAHELNISSKELASLDFKKINAAIEILTGQHDFKGFCTDKTKKSTVRTLDQITFEATKDYYTFTFTGQGFLYNMVRILVGTLLEIGTDNRSLESLTHIFESKKRADAGFTAPAKGLTLERIEFINSKTILNNQN